VAARFSAFTFIGMVPTVPISTRTERGFYVVHFSDFGKRGHPFRAIPETAFFMYFAYDFAHYPYREIAKARYYLKREFAYHALLCCISFNGEVNVL